MTLSPYLATLAEKYESKMTGQEQMTRAGYLVTVEWEGEIDDAGKFSRILEYNRVRCGLVKLCTGVKPRPCVSTIRPRKT